jgi:hypothetical protein
MNPSETDKNGVNQIAVSAGSAQEYFLTEYRYRSSAATYDKGISMSGLVVWHVDDAVALDSFIFSQNYVNTPSKNGVGHRGIDVVEADSIEPDPQGRNDLGTGDAFIDGQTFTAPQSNTFTGGLSGVTIASISGVGTASISNSVAFIKATTGLNILKTANYPNPAGDPAKYPVRAGAAPGTLTTLAIHLSRPIDPGKLELDIYTMNGDRVRSVSGDSIPLKLGTGEPSADFKWVYEFDWDGRSDSEDPVAPGVYFYRFKADNDVKNGKMVLIR